MMINEYCENILIQQTMADFLQEKLGWKVSYAHNKEKLGANGTYGRESYEEVILPKQFAAAVKKAQFLAYGRATRRSKKSLGKSSCFCFPDDDKRRKTYSAQRRRFCQLC